MHVYFSSGKATGPLVREKYFFFGGRGVFFFFFLKAAPAAYESSQARGGVGAVAASLYHSHSNTRSELCLQPTVQLTARTDP